MKIRYYVCDNCKNNVYEFIEETRIARCTKCGEILENLSIKGETFKDETEEVNEE